MRQVSIRWGNGLTPSRRPYQNQRWISSQTQICVTSIYYVKMWNLTLDSTSKLYLAAMCCFLIATADNPNAASDEYQMKFSPSSFVDNHLSWMNSTENLFNIPLRFSIRDNVHNIYTKMKPMLVDIWIMWWYNVMSSLIKSFHQTHYVTLCLSYMASKFEDCSGPRNLKSIHKCLY